MQSAFRAWPFVVMLLAAPALALPPGASLWVITADARLLKDPRASARPVASLTRGQEVKWLGVSERDKTFQQVEADGKKGFVPTAALSSARPQLETGADAKPMSAPSFAASGSSQHQPPRTNPGSRDPRQAEADAELSAVEALNRDQVTPAALDAKRKSLLQR